MKKKMLHYTFLATVITFSLIYPEQSEIQMKNILSVHHPFFQFSGSYCDYSFSSFRDKLLFKQPDLNKWVLGLQPQSNPRQDRFTRIWKDGSGVIRYIYCKKEQHHEFISINKNSVEMEIPGFITQVGVGKWKYVYQNNLLFRQYYYRLIYPPNLLSRLKDYSGVSLYGLDIYEYSGSDSVPHTAYFYEKEEDVVRKKWKHKKTFDSSGRVLSIIPASR